jgi:hypothetical protein
MTAKGGEGRMEGGLAAGDGYGASMALASTLNESNRRDMNV